MITDIGGGTQAKGVREMVLRRIFRARRDKVTGE